MSHCLYFLFTYCFHLYSTSSLTRRLSFTYGHTTRYRCLCAAEASVLSVIKTSNSNKKLNTVGLYPAVVLMCRKRNMRAPSMRILSYRLMSREITSKSWSQSNLPCSHYIHISSLLSSIVSIHKSFEEEEEWEVIYDSNSSIEQINDSWLGTYLKPAVLRQIMPFWDPCFQSLLNNPQSEEHGKREQWRFALWSVLLHCISYRQHTFGFFCFLSG